MVSQRAAQLEVEAHHRGDYVTATVIGRGGGGIFCTSPQVLRSSAQRSLRTPFGAANQLWVEPSNLPWVKGAENPNSCSHTRTALSLCARHSRQTREPCRWRLFERRSRPAGGSWVTGPGAFARSPARRREFPWAHTSAGDARPPCAPPCSSRAMTSREKLLHPPPRPRRYRCSHDGSAHRHVC